MDPNILVNVVTGYQLLRGILVANGTPLHAIQIFE